MSGKLVRIGGEVGFGFEYLGLKLIHLKKISRKKSETKIVPLRLESLFIL